MNFARKLPMLICFFSTFSMIFPGWNEQVREYADTYSTPYKDGYLASLAATCKMKKISYDDMLVPVEKWKIFSQKMEKGFINVDVGLQVDPDHRVIKAPLAIYIPGSFVNLNEKQSNRWMDSLTRLGYHTAVFPNPFSLDFLKQIPLTRFGTLTDEAQILYEAIRNLHDLLRRRQVLNGSVRLIGVSSGGFFSSVITALDAEHPNPVITTDTTIMAPGFHMGRGMDRLDHLVDTHRNPYQEMSLVRMLIKLRRICRLEDPSNPPQQILEDGRGLVTFAGFYEELVDSVTRYDEIHSFGKVPGGGKALRRWRDQFKFSAYYDQFNPSGKKLIYSEAGHLYHWIARAYKAGFPSVRILTTTDDFFNDPGVWGSMEENPLTKDLDHRYGLMQDPALWERIQQDLIVLEDGGHYGFRTNPWFEGFIQAAFSTSGFNIKKWSQFNELFKEPEKDQIQTESLIHPLR